LNPARLRLVGEATFFTESARKRVTEAVVRLESQTAAEVVVVVSRTSASWRAIDLAVGAATGFGVLLVALFHPMPIPVVAIPLDVVLGFAAGMAACAGLSPLKRALVGKARAREQVRTMARAAFVERGISKTAGRTGLLVYVSTFERLVEVVADISIADASFADQREALRSCLTGGADFEAFVVALCALGPPLARSLPRSPDDVNELPDEPVIA
jgi:putative membrane protein